MCQTVLYPEKALRQKKWNLSKKKKKETVYFTIYKAEFVFPGKILTSLFIIRTQAIPRHKNVLYVLKPKFFFC